MYAGINSAMEAIEKGISDLVANHDIIAEANRQYIVGYIAGNKGHRSTGQRMPWRKGWGNRLLTTMGQQS